jgi:hypothetical protein
MRFWEFEDSENKAHNLIIARDYEILSISDIAHIVPCMSAPPSEITTVSL